MSSLRTSAIDGAESLLIQIVDTIEVQPPRATLRGGAITREYLRKYILGIMFEDKENADASESAFRALYSESKGALMSVVLRALRKYFKRQRVVF